MANSNPNQDNLTKYKSQWKSGKTKTIRVPEKIADKILEIAHLLDEDKITVTSDIKEISINKSTKLKDYNSITVTSDIKNILQNGLKIPSNKGGEIKRHLAEIGKLLGFEIEQDSRKRWKIKS